MKTVFFLSLLSVSWLLTSQGVCAFSDTSVTPSTMTPGAQATYLFEFTPSVTVPVSGSLEVSMQTSFTWPSSLGTSDIELTVDDVIQSLSGVPFGGFTLTNPGVNQLTLTLPSSTTISTSSSVTLLLGRQANFYNPSTEGNHSFSITTRDASGNLLESGAGIILIQDTRVGVSSEIPSEERGGEGHGARGRAVEEEAPEEEEVEEGESIEDFEEETSTETEVIDVSQEPTYDFNHDGVVDIQDINIFLEWFESYPEPSADYNLDGFINVKDFSLLLTEYSNSSAYDEAYAPPTVGQRAGESSYANRFVVGPARDREPAFMYFQGEDTEYDWLEIIPVSFRFALREDLVIVHALVDTGPSGIQVVDATLRYDPQLLVLEDVYIEDALFSIWAKHPYEISQGTIRFVAGTPKPFIGSNGYIATFEFAFKQDGEAQFSYTEDTVAYTPGASWLDLFFGGLVALLRQPSVAFEPAEIPGVPLRSSTHPYEGQWYRSAQVSLLLDDALFDREGDRFLYALDQGPSVQEDEITLSASATHLDLTIPSDGRWYVHVLRERDGQKSEISTYELAIDQTPPLPFDLSATKFETVNGERWMLSFHAQDEMSGIKEYWIQQGSMAETTTDERFFVPRLENGYYHYTVHAVDRAGNIRSQDVSIVSGSEEIQRTITPWLFFLLLLLLIFHCFHREHLYKDRLNVSQLDF